ncbi:MAG: endonuclease domain-containing protein [Planctomycetes bacterium]|nr:endonuclease domain-containing protein [Planctomycetota bacterium]
MKTRARKLRHAGSVPERILWGMLRARRLSGFKFRRQQPIGPFVVDFFCEEAELVVELDGESHVGQGEMDAQQSALLRKRALPVMRITNDDLLNHRDEVGEAILPAAQQPKHRSALTPNPSPKGRGGQ